jgi:hypothetical protein
MHPSKMPLGSQPNPGSTLNSRLAQEPKKARKSSQNLDAEAKAAKSVRAPRPSGTNESRRRRSSRPPPTEVQPPPTTDAGGYPETPGAVPAGATPRSPSVADQIDAWPTQAMEGDALSDLTEMARIAPPAVPRTSPSRIPPAPAGGAATQAVRVVVWRTPDGVRVAPVGTAVQSPTVEAILVSLDPAADLAGWLARR